MQNRDERNNRMGWRARIRKALSLALKSYHFEIIESNLLYDWQKNPNRQASYKQSKLSIEAQNYLQENNPKLQDLQARYANFNGKNTSQSIWTDVHVKPQDISYFRGDNAYVWQLRGQNMSTIGYALSTFYVKSIDKLKLFERLEEDESFGIFTFRICNQLVSRDLLDSIMEMYFLEKHLEISRSKDLNILDIGAGYGRLAYQMVTAFPNIQNYLCTDGIAVSSFISEYYLRFRKIEDRAKVIPLDEIENSLMNKAINIAVNVHSFSECSLASIDWWVSLLKKHQVQYLMIVPNAYNNGGKLLQTHGGEDFGEVIEKYGYRLLAKDPKYRDPVVQEYGINPTYYYLFELQ